MNKAMENETKVLLGTAQLKQRFRNGTEAEKQLLKDLFGVQLFTVPTLDDYRTIKTYEDACEVLGVEPIDEAKLAEAGVPSHTVALMKLETVSRALWGKDWQPKPQAELDGSTWYWWPIWWLLTKEEVADIKADKDHQGYAALFGGRANDGAYAGFGYLHTHGRPAGTNANVGFRLCQESKEKARYFGSTFAELWVEYLAFNFTVGERIF